MKWFQGLGTLWKVAVIVGLFLLAMFAWNSMAEKIRDWLYGDPDVIRAEADAEVAREQGAAEQEIGKAATDAVIERHYYHDRTTKIVEQAKRDIAAADDGGMINEEMDAAGAAALCGLHDSLCRGAGQPPAVQ